MQILWHDSSQRRRDLPEKREESEAARIGRETHFGQPETSGQKRKLTRFAERTNDESSRFACGFGGRKGSGD
jgi:hypothetical protein